MAKSSAFKLCQSLHPISTKRFLHPFVKIGEHMKKQQVVPDVLDEPPKESLNIAYGNLVVQEGSTLTPTQVKSQPNVEWKFESGAFYTLCMTDPDAPSRQNPKYREWHHWLVGNIFENEIDNGDTLSEYIGAGPPKGTGLHRYVFALYKQPARVDFDETVLTNRSGNARGGFSIRKFAKKYKLGKPVAGSFFLAEYDDYVPKLYKQLGN